MQNTLEFCVYKITNLISGKSYIGKTKDLKSRWKGHLNGSKDLKNDYKFPRALRKYSEDTWDISILYETDDEDHCYEVEIISVDEYDTFHNGYNSCGGGKGVGSGENHHMFGRIGENHPNFGNRWNMSQEQVKAISGENNPMFGKFPWENPACKSKGLQINWFYMDKVYDLRIRNGPYYGPARIYNKLVKDHPDIKKSPTSFQSMFKWIKKNGNPKNNKDWLDFRNSF